MDPVLILYLNEGSGTTAYDRSGLNNHGTIYNPIWVQKWIDWFLYFDGQSDYVLIPDNDSINPLKEMTILMWVYPVTDMYGGGTWTCLRKGNNQYLIEPGDVGTNYWAFGVNIGGTFYRVDTTSALPINQWIQIGGRFSSSLGRIDIIVNGSVNNTRSVSGTIQRQSGGLYLGKWGGEIFKGYIGEVLMFSRYLPDDQIKFFANIFRGELRKPPSF